MKHPAQKQRWIPEIRRRAAGAALSLAIVLALAMVAVGSAQAQTYAFNLLHAFTGAADGGEPAGGLVLDGQGNLYGTASSDGIRDECCGVVFKIDRSGHQTAGTPADGETVSFMKGQKVLGTGKLKGGSASFTISTPSLGTKTITAVYVGDPTHSASTSNVVEQVVEKAGKL
jgi:hypothetical protein